MLPLAIVIITLALLFYTVGVWAERLRRSLKWWHAGAFLLGLICDATGTFLMSLIADDRAAAGETASVLNSIMIVSGALALILMAVHLIWSVIVLVRDRPSEKRSFHRFSLFVWAIWLFPYVTGAVGAM
ncbi:HsmA family protein [Streptosporangium sp. CA-115845]|uniref:HsmA family protein n=1 Tax=Streptosporangium sp. CA-115845 TaxID=3240071 RepID=UPI003D8F74F1